MPDSLSSEIVAVARRCIGTRFRLQGRDPANGLDCIGLVIWSAAQCGLMLPDEADYLLSDRPERLDAAIARASLQRINLESVQVGDLVRLMSHGQPLHLAICGGDSLIHADMRLRRVVEHRITPEWRARFVAAYRFERA